MLFRSLGAGKVLVMDNMPGWNSSKKWQKMLNPNAKSYEFYQLSWHLMNSSVSSANLGYSSLISKSLMKTLKRTGRKMEPWGMPLIPNVTPFTLNLWTLPISQLFTHCIMPLSSYMLWETITEVLLISKKIAGFHLTGTSRFPKPLKNNWYSLVENAFCITGRAGFTACLVHSHPSYSLRQD